MGIRDDYADFQGDVFYAVAGGADILKKFSIFSVNFQNYCKSCHFALFNLTET